MSMDEISTLLSAVGWLAVITMVGLMLAGAIVFLCVGLYIAPGIIADKVDAAWFRFRVRRIKRQMERVE